jgi:hypothetical protein
MPDVTTLHLASSARTTYGFLSEHFGDTIEFTDDSTAAELVLVDLNSPGDTDWIRSGSSFFAMACPTPVLLTALHGKPDTKFLNVIRTVFPVVPPIYRSPDALEKALRWVRTTFPFRNLRRPSPYGMKEVASDLVLAATRDEEIARDMGAPGGVQTLTPFGQDLSTERGLANPLSVELAADGVLTRIYLASDATGGYGFLREAFGDTLELTDDPTVAELVLVDLNNPGDTDWIRSGTSLFVMICPTPVLLTALHSKPDPTFLKIIRTVLPVVPPIYRSPDALVEALAWVHTALPFRNLKSVGVTGYNDIIYDLVLQRLKRAESRIADPHAGRAEAVPSRHAGVIDSGSAQEHDMHARSGVGTKSAKTLTEGALYLDTDDDQVIALIESQFSQLLAIVGGAPQWAPPERGSWLRRFRSRLSPNDIDTLKRALEVAVLDAPEGSANRDHAEAAARLIEASKDISTVVLHVGTVLLIKSTDGNGRSSIAVTTLSPTQQLELRERGVGQL